MRSKTRRTASCHPGSSRVAQGSESAQGGELRGEVPPPRAPPKESGGAPRGESAGTCRRRRDRPAPPEDFPGTRAWPPAFPPPDRGRPAGRPTTPALRSIPGAPPSGRRNAGPERPPGPPCASAGPPRAGIRERTPRSFPGLRGGIPRPGEIGPGPNPAGRRHGPMGA